MVWGNLATGYWLGGAAAAGLLAAVPAVIAYNKFTSDSRKYSGRIENFSKRFLSII